MWWWHGAVVGSHPRPTFPRFPGQTRRRGAAARVAALQVLQLHHRVGAAAELVGGGQHTAAAVRGAAAGAVFKLE